MNRWWQEFHFWMNYSNVHCLESINFLKCFLCSPGLHLFDQKYSKTVILWNIITVKNNFSILVIFFRILWVKSLKEHRRTHLFEIEIFCNFLSLLSLLFSLNPKMKILSLITHPHVIPHPQDLRSSLKHKLRYFWWNPRGIWLVHRQRREYFLCAKTKQK